MICDAEGVRTALAEARALNADIRANGIACGRPAEAVRALQWQQMALASEAVLARARPLRPPRRRQPRRPRHPRSRRRGAAGDGQTDPLEAYRFRTERDADRTEQIVVRLDGDSLHISTATQSIVRRERHVRSSSATGRTG